MALCARHYVKYTTLQIFKKKKQNLRRLRDLPKANRQQINLIILTQFHDACFSIAYIMFWEEKEPIFNNISATNTAQVII